MIEIRSFGATDLEFENLTRISNLINHDSVDHPDDEKNSWEIRDKSLIKDRLLLYESNELIGAAYYNQGRAENGQTNFFNIELNPDYNGNSYRELLYQKMLEKIKAFNCNKLLTTVYDHPNYKHYKKFLEKHGYRLVQTNREYTCDITQLDTAKYQPLINKLESEGISFYDSKKEMKDNPDKFPDYFKKLEKLEWTYAQDFPIPDGVKHTRTPFKQFMKFTLDYYENCYGMEIIAVFNGEYIGSTNLYASAKTEQHKAWTGGLGVLKKFRRKGIATAIKIKAIEALVEKGITEVRTDNEENNPMYKINVALGFKPVPFSLEYMKKI